MEHDQIIIRGARLHNLKNIDVSIPKNKLVVFTGLSGSGKSSLAFDILHKEGARQYMESLGLVTDGLSKVPVDFISGLSPSISVDQHPGSHNPRSTLGTATEIYTYLRVLFARLGHRPCPKCGGDVPPSDQIHAFQDDDGEPDENGGVFCPNCAASLPELGMANFSFNKPAGACPTCTGLGETADLLAERCFNQAMSLVNGGVTIWDPFNAERFIIALQRAGAYYGFEFDAQQPLGELGEVQRDLLYYGVNSEKFSAHFPGVKAPNSVMKGYFEGVVTNLWRRYREGLSESGLSVKLEQLFVTRTCPDCQGTRLHPASRRVTVNGRSIIQVSQMPLQQSAEWLEDLPHHLSSSEMLIADPILKDLNERIERLVTIGVGYLTLDRATPSLSAGEGQRLRLASLLGSRLSGVLYVLDEPTIGLHQRDTRRLVEILRRLRDLGNTVLVIEHDLEMINAADHIIEFGPGAGKEGGLIIAAGTPQQLHARSDTPTSAFLSGQAALPLHSPRCEKAGELVIHKARHNNLKDISVSIPLKRLVAVSGVSGSGKSSLIFDILDRAGRQRYFNARETPGAHEGINGWSYIDRLVTVDQSPIGRVPRSNAATYTDVFTPIREVFAASPAARQRGLKAAHFSFNVPGGRCERCEGAGLLTINMHFLPDVQVRCPICHGRRFKKEVLAVKYNGVDIAAVLDMSINEALEIFKKETAIAPRLKLLAEVGLGYLQLGQPATTLSGGEAQRVKLAKELARRGSGHTLYLLDEPTTGLHPADVSRLLTLLQRLVDAGNTVVVVEHHLELIRAADWIIDLGPEGGDAGGQLLACGTPQQVAGIQSSFTGQCLQKIMN
ncbi:MAG: excinuclease ABC subunit UvrA [Anaerolineae bacterium]|nr:excinuclease ABC subunit UvrA [Anaerolineae bacterium]